jgi:DNA polymerase-3 subunit delta
MARVSWEKMQTRLAAGKPIAAIVLEGDDVYLRDLCHRQIIENFVPEGSRDWAVQRLSAKDASWDEVFQRAQTLPMLAAVQVLIVSNLEAWERLGDDASKELAESLSQYLDDPAPFTVLLLEAAKFDDRRRLGKTLSEEAGIVTLTAGPEQTAAVVSRIASDLGASIDSAGAAALAEMFPGDLGRVRAEIDKLSLYAAGRSITRADVDALVVTERKATVWQLADVLAAGRGDAALLFLDSALRAGEQPAAMVGALAWMYRKLIEALDLPASASGWDAARRLNMRPESAALAVRNSRRIPRQLLLDGLAALGEADNLLKSGISQPRAVLEFLITGLTCNAGAEGRAHGA